MQRFLAIIVLLLLSSCSNVPPPQQVVRQTNEVGRLTINALLSDPQTWVGRDMILTSPVVVFGDGYLLISGQQIVNDRITPLTDPGTSIWLVTPLEAPQQQQLIDGAGYLKLTGQLNPPGGYGPDGRYPYQFKADSVVVVPPEQANLANLAQNRSAFNSSVLRIRGTLLSTTDTLILSEDTSEGGVPSSTAHQLKLRPLPDPSILATFTASGDVRYGGVEIVGWWEQGVLTPWLVQPLASSP